MMHIIDRRTALKVIAAGAIWTAPIVAAIPPAAARDLHSRPAARTKPRVAEPMMGPPLPNDLPAQLPFTGDDSDDAIVIGAGALIAGAALVALGARGREALDG